MQQDKICPIAVVYNVPSLLNPTQAATCSHTLPILLLLPSYVLPVFPTSDHHSATGLLFRLDSIINHQRGCLGL